MPHGCCRVVEILWHFRSGTGSLLFGCEFSLGCLDQWCNVSKRSATYGLANGLISDFLPLVGQLEDCFPDLLLKGCVVLGHVPAPILVMVSAGNTVTSRYHPDGSGKEEMVPIHIGEKCRGQKGRVFIGLIVSGRFGGPRC